MQSLRVGITTAFNLTHAPPINVRWISVLFVASHYAALAADALAHIEMKSILFSRQQITLWNLRGFESR
jgi:hypothetical protein